MNINKSSPFANDQVDDQFENEEDSSLAAPNLLDGVVVTGTDWTTETILSQLQKGNISLNPRFQRREAWDDKRKSKFIESILLGLPIPQLVLAEQRDSRGRYIVIDGKQRLLSLIKFAGHSDDNNLKLRGLEIRSDLNGMTWSDFVGSDMFANDVAAFENAQIRTTTIRGWRDERALYLIFHRLNSGSVSLSPQELRHTLHPGSFIDFAFDFTESSAVFIDVLGRRGKPDFRMRDVELLIRYIGLKMRLSAYQGDLKKFLDGTVQELNQSWSSVKGVVEELSRQCELAIEHTISIFPDRTAFVKWTEEGPERRFNRAVFDVMTYYFCDPDTRKATESYEQSELVVNKFKDLCVESGQFLKSLETTTKTTEAVVTRLYLWGLALKDVIQRTPKGFHEAEELAREHGIC